MILASILAITSGVEYIRNRNTKQMPPVATIQDSREDPYAFRKKEEYRKFFSNALWDYEITTKKGDTLWNISKETAGSADMWEEIQRTNIYFGTFRKSFRPECDLHPGQRIIVYMSPEYFDEYGKKYPERNIGKNTFRAKKKQQTIPKRQAE